MVRIFALLMMILLSTVLMGGSGWAQQCTEDTQLARLSPAIVGGGVSAAGCTEPDAGTTLGGNSTRNDFTSDWTTTNYGWYTGAGHSVTWAETCTTTTVSKVEVWVWTFTNTQNVKAKLYNNDNSEVTNGTTNSVSTNGMEGAWLPLPFATPPTLTKGNTYKIVTTFDANDVLIGTNSAAGDIYSQTPFSYASPPATLAGSDTSNTATLCVRIVK